MTGQKRNVQVYGILFSVEQLIFLKKYLAIAIGTVDFRAVNLLPVNHLSLRLLKINLQEHQTLSCLCHVLKL